MKIAQDQHYVGKDWWDWSVWIDAPAAELERIQKVVWRLHPTFVEPVREVTTRANGFRLQTSGWGTFRVFAQVVMDDGNSVKLQHDLELYYPEGGRAPA